mmetsp:Transcript_43489/g.112904  ORF Transcript_43489/g.112904 Transcript_43489/m.112904 type:complete len:594 (-) Transcript_43489:412-2193(-)
MREWRKLKPLRLRARRIRSRRTRAESLEHNSNGSEGHGSGPEPDDGDVRAPSWGARPVAERQAVLDVCGRLAEVRDKGACGLDPTVLRQVPVGEVMCRQGEAEFLRVSRLQRIRLLERLHDRSRLPGLGRELQVELHNRGGGDLAGVPHARAEAVLAALGPGASLVDGRLVLEGGVRQAVAEREGRFKRRVAVARGQTLGVRHVRGIARPHGVRLRLRQHDRQPARGHLLAEEDIGPCVARLLPSEEHDRDAIDLVPPRHDDGPWRSDQDDRLLGHLADRIDELVYIPVEVQVQPVPRLATGGACNDDGYVHFLGNLSRDDGVVGQGLHHLHVQGLCLRPQTIKGSDNVASKMATATSGVVVASRPIATLTLSCTVRVVGRSICSGTNDGDALGRSWGEGQDLILIFQEDDGLGCGSASELNVLRRGNLFEEVLLAIRRGALRRLRQIHSVHHCEHPLRGFVHGFRGRVLQLVCIVVLPVAFGAFARAHARHLLVQATLDAVGVRGPPIRLHEAPEAHLVVQDVEVLRVRTRVYAIDLVVGAHESPDSCIDRCLKWRQVQFPSRLVIDLGRLAIAPGLLLIEHPMLRNAEDAL